MSDLKFPVPDARLLPGDPIHPADARLPVSELVVEPLSTLHAIRLDLRCPRKADIQNLEDVYVTRRFLLSKECASSLAHEILRALDQD